MCPTRFDIYGWGGNQFGQIGNGIYNECKSKPFKINESISENFKAISCETLHSLALTEDGRVFWLWVQ